MLKRLAGIVPTVFGVLLLTFLLVHLVPGDPVDVMLGESAAAGDRAQLRAELGLDQPLMVQFGHYLVKLTHGDLGVSVHGHAKITDLLAKRYPATLRLALSAFTIAMLVGIPLGILAALHHQRWPDRARASSR